MVLEKAGGDVTADGFAGGFAPFGAEALGHEFEVFFEMFLRPGYGDEFDEAVGSVVREPVRVGDWDDAVLIGREG